MRHISQLSFKNGSHPQLRKCQLWYKLKRYYGSHNLFDELPRRDLCSVNCHLTKTSCKRNYNSTWVLFCKVHAAIRFVDSYTLTPVLTACAALPEHERGQQLHAVIIKIGADSGTVTKTALIDVYSKHGFLKDSVKLFEEITFHDVVTWNTLLSGFLRNGHADKAIQVFANMRREGIEYSEFTLCSVLKACASLAAIRQGKQIHGVVVVLGRDLIVLSTALIDFYSGCGDVNEAMNVFSSLSFMKDDVMLNSLVSGLLINRRYKDAFSLIISNKPNAVVFTTVLAACSENSDLWIGMQIHCLAMRLEFTRDTRLCNVLLNMYAKCGKIATARSIFDRIHNKDVVSWTSMIDACGRHGNGKEALRLFQKMGEVEHEVLPNSVTFLSVLSACRHSGGVEEARRLFDSVMEKHGLQPTTRHYCCLIDILGKAGLIAEVWLLYDKMIRDGIRPAHEVWASILGACSTNMDALGGEFAAKNLLDSGSKNSGNFVLLSNFYASVGKWDAVDRLRSYMKEKELIKEVGSSWVSVQTPLNLKR